MLLVLVTTLLVARPLVLGEEPGLTDSLADPWGMILTLLWLTAAFGWAVWRFWLRPQGPGASPPRSAKNSKEASFLAFFAPWREDSSEANPRNWYGGIVQTALLVTVAIVFLSAELAAHYKFPARLIAWEWLGLFTAFFVVRQLAVTPAEQRGLFAVLLAGAVSLAAQGIYQAVVELPQNRKLAEDPEKLRATWAEESPGQETDEGFLEGLRRRALENNIYGPYAHPNSYAGYLVLWLPGLIGAAILCRRMGAPNWQTILTACGAVLGGAALWLTHSRGAILGLALVGVGVIVLLWRRTLRTHLLVTLVSALVLAGLVYGAWRGGLLTRGMGKGSNAVAQRLEYWQTTERIIQERPWLGVGPGNFRENYTRLMPETAEEKIKDPHNFALEMWATCGVFALLALLVALALFFARMVRWLAQSPSPLYSGERGWGEGERGATTISPLTPNPSPPTTAERGGGGAEPPPVRWEFYLGGVFGLLLGFVLRVNAASPSTILAETWTAALRAVVWFAAYGLFERVIWSERGRALALTAGVAALLLNLCVSGGIMFSSVAGPLWVAVALALNARSLQPSLWLSRSGFAAILPVPILGALVLGYGTYVLYPILAGDGLLHEALRFVAAYRINANKPTAQRGAAIRNAPDDYLRKHVITLLEEAVRLTPDDARLHVQLAWWYGNVWDLNMQRTTFSNPKLAELAIAHGERAIRLDPQGGQGYLVCYQLRMLFGTRNDDVADRGRNRDPLRVGELKEVARQQYRQAAEVMESQLPNDPAEAKLRYLLARAWFKAGDTEKGRKQAEEAQRLDEAVVSPTRKLTDRQRKQVRDWLSPSVAR